MIAADPVMPALDKTKDRKTKDTIRKWFLIALAKQKTAVKRTFLIDE